MTDIEKLAEELEYWYLHEAAAALRSEHEARVKAETSFGMAKKAAEFWKSKFGREEARAIAAERERDEAARKHAKISEWITLDCRTQYERAEAAEARAEAAERERDDLRLKFVNAALEAEDAERRLAAAERENERLREALKAADDALANVTAFEDDARYIMGNTNFEIVKARREQVRAALGGNNAEPA